MEKARGRYFPAAGCRTPSPTCVPTALTRIPVRFWRDLLGFAGWVRLGGGLRPPAPSPAGPGAVSDPGRESEATPHPLLRGVEGARPPPRRCPRQVQALSWRSPGSCRGVGRCSFYTTFGIAYHRSIFLLLSGGPRVSAYLCDPLTAAP